MPSSIDSYEVLEPIGSGTFGTCKKVRRKKDGRVLVWKEIDYSKMTEDAKQMLVLEVNLLRELRHDNIVRYYDRVIDKPRSTLYIVMEYCEGGDLASYIKKMKTTQSQVPEEFVWQVCHQMASALSECHSRSRNGNRVLHRDLKPANIFLDARRNAKIGDFGLARVLKPNTSFTKTCVGTPYYMSPEQITGCEYNERCDVWSLGCILYEMCSLRPPFNADSHLELVRRVTSGQLARIPDRYSDDLFTLISLLLLVDRTKRPSVEELLSHPLLLARFFPSRPDNTLTRSPASGESQSTRSEALRAREQSLEERETRLTNVEDRLKKRALELDAREKLLSVREKLTEERMAKAEKLLAEYAEAKLSLLTKPSPLSDHFTSDDSGTAAALHPKREIPGDFPASSGPSRDARKVRRTRHSSARRPHTPGVLRTGRAPLSRYSAQENEGVDITLKQSDYLQDGRSPLERIDQRSDLFVFGQRALPLLPQPEQRRHSRPHHAK